ncbi:hypothetical protein [Deinococcus misasensis]|nr:hypothetical protein [Deinococcus misasensis]
MQEVTPKPETTQTGPEASPRPVCYQPPRLIKQGQWQAVTMLSSMDIGLQ